MIRKIILIAVWGIGISVLCNISFSEPVNYIVAFIGGGVGGYLIMTK